MPSSAQPTHDQMFNKAETGKGPDGNQQTRTKDKYDSDKQLGRETWKQKDRKESKTNECDEARTSHKNYKK